MRFDEVSVARLGTEAAARAAVVSLRRGGLVAHPTATVYGIGGPADPGTDAEIGRLKGRPGDRPLLRLVADVAALRRAWPQAVWSEAAARAAAAFWPGPLTLVLDDGTPSGTAVRVEAHPAVRALLVAWGGVMSSTSLNRSGEQPARDPDGARRALAAFPDSTRDVLLLEAGTLPGLPPSTLLSLRGGVARVLRPGAIPAARVREEIGDAARWAEESGGPWLLFVCTGNTCRSPLAEWIARAEAERRGLAGVEVRSAGTEAYPGDPAARLAREVAESRGLAVTPHRSAPLTAEAVRWADLVIGMSPSHLAAAIALDAGRPVALATDYLPADHPERGLPVPDPIGGSRARYEWTFDVLSACVRGLFDQLPAPARRGDG